VGVKIIVLGGGESDERDVSSTSAAAVASALRTLGHEVEEVDPARWPEPAQFRSDVPPEPPDQDETIRLTERVRANLTTPEFWQQLRAADLVFLALHGGIGESGHLRACLELQQIRSTGADSLTVMNAWNKLRARHQFERAGIPVPAGRVASPAMTDDELAKLLDELGGDAVVKPITGGSTIGVNRVRSTAEFRQALAEIGASALAETRLDGSEFTVAVVADECLPPVMIQPKEGWFGYAAKYQPKASLELCPAPVSPELTERLCTTALAAARSLGFDEHSYARVDLMLDDAGVPRCLEVNALPGLTPNSLLPRAAAAVGWSFPALVERLLGLTGADAAL
jgi:D-alanine-D-alanine ligase